MANTLRIKRRALGGASGAPSTLAQSELAWSEVDQILYVGQSSGGGASVIAIGGPGSYATKSFVATAVAAVDVSGQLASYLTTASAASTYLTQASATANYATHGYVTTAISDVIGAAPAALDTLKELADALGSDANYAATITTSLGGKMSKASNLSDVADVATARASLGLGSMALQAASSVAITGGSIDGIDLSGGTF